jgi:DNA-binding CsgD family transcriptional regulator
MMTLRREIAAAREGKGGIVLVSGPAGIGKSRLVEEAVADEAGVVWGRCPADEGAPPLWAWLRILRRLPADLLPTVGAGAAAAVTMMDAAESAGERFRLLVGLTDALVAAAADLKGLVIVVEDLHDADEVSLALLRQVAYEAARSWLLVIVTHRDVATRPATGFLRTLADLSRSRAARRVPLAPLTAREVARYLQVLPDGVAIAPLVHERSGGLPLLVAAMARRIGQASGTPSSRERLPALPPADMSLLVEEMLGGLDAEARETVTAAAVLGDDLDVALLAEIADLGAAAVTSQLSTLAKAGLLAVIDDAPPRYRFTHAIVREAIVADSATTAALHERAALVLQRRVGTDPAQAARIAIHWQYAIDSAEAQRSTVGWMRAAAAHALTVLAHGEAARLLERALGALDRTGPEPAKRAELLLELASAEHLAGWIPQCVQHCRDAADAAQSAERSDLLAASALVLSAVGDPAIGMKAAALCDRALSASAPTPVVRARLLARKACLEAETHRSAGTTQLSAEALRQAEASGDRLALLDAVRARIAVLDLPDDVGERLQMGELAVRGGLSTGRRVNAVLGHTWRIDAGYQLAQLSDVDDEIARLGGLASTAGQPIADFQYLRAMAARAALAGRFAQARAQSAAAGEIATRTGAPFMASITVTFAAVLAHMRGDPREIPAGYAATFTALTRAPVIEAAHAFCLYLDAGREAALAKYERLRLLLREPITGVRGTAVLQLVTELVEAFEDSEAAAWAYARWLPWTATAGLPGNAITFCFGSSARAVGRMAAIMGRLDEAAEALRAAAEVNRRLDARPWLVHTWLALAGVLGRRDTTQDRLEAVTLATRATIEARQLDLPGPLVRASRLLTQLDAQRRTEDPLSPREREVADLVVQALSNRQIADRLVLSERTVESHVRNILIKLGVSNRTQLIAHLLGNQH